MRRLAVGMLCALSLLGCVEDGADTSTRTVEQPLCPGAGVMSNQWTFSHNGFDHDYWGYVPTTFDHCTGEFPLILIFHGGGGNADDFKELSFFDELRTRAETVGAVLVWIDAGTSDHKWNASHCCTTDAIDHVDMVDAWLDTQLAVHLDPNRIDPDRIHALGFSNGGAFAQYLAIEMTDTFASVASIAGWSGTFINPNKPPACWNPYDPACGPWSAANAWGGTTPANSSDTAMFLIRGEEDYVVPVHGLSALNFKPSTTQSGLWMPAITNPYLAGDTDYERWIVANGCTTLTATSTAGYGAEYHCTGGGPTVRHDIVENMHHRVPVDIPGDPNHANYDGPMQVAQFFWNNPK